MTNILLVFENGDDLSQFYLLKDLTKDEIEILEKANGKHINVDEDTEYVDKVCQLIASDDSSCEEPGHHDNCKWYKFKATTPIREEINAVYNCGFVW